MAKGRTEAPIPTRINPFGWDLISWIPLTGIGHKIGNFFIKTANVGLSGAGYLVGFRDRKGNRRFNILKTRGERLTPVGNIIKGTKNAIVNTFSWTKEKFSNGRQRTKNVASRSKNKVVAGVNGLKNLGKGAKNIVSGSASGLKEALSGNGGGMLNTRLGKIVSGSLKKIRLIASRPFRKIAETAHNLNSFVAPYLDGSGKLTEAFKNTTVGNYIVKTGDFAMNFDTIATNALKNKIQQPLIDNLLSPGEKQLERLAAVPGTIIKTLTTRLDNAIGNLSTGVDRLLSPVKQLDAALVPVKK